MATRAPLVIRTPKPRDDLPAAVALRLRLAAMKRARRAARQSKGMCK